MNQHLMEILARQIIGELPEVERQLYEYITEMEDSLAAQSSTSDQFMTLLVKHSPHQQAADQFGLSFEKTMVKMKQIEMKIDNQLEEKMKYVKWTDVSEEVLGSKRHRNGSIMIFHFDM
ncbi:hypothetical protein [Jeotgalibacillus campisalis]|uniref:Uncharacterized protein n=1 Tax=Jeotgalibacillus campisalis TaxID=220754 RepID=A0A0C2SB48_9BACL|nr:hypothetical protein [Jeotgalibacillus campisalis]KIL51179.1 hypothetical protein KR50_10600 [Jeotgalibacillus campisalis]